MSSYERPSDIAHVTTRFDKSLGGYRRSDSAASTLALGIQTAYPTSTLNMTMSRSASNDSEVDISPKVEELDDDGSPHGVKAESEILQGTEGAVNAARKRGRPRKHPLAPPPGFAKAGKCRSKTGCITCRRRKKKCDEAKPHCLNCQKTAVVCEGYPVKAIWQSGKQRADAEQGRSLFASDHLYIANDRPFTGIRAAFDLPRELPILIDGVETEIDRRFLDHFVLDFSRVLTLINNDSNPFKEILLPMATQHKGLMHSLMCLSGSHLSQRDPNPVLKERKHYHFDKAITDLRKNINAATGKEPELMIEDPTIASTVTLCLNTICEGETNGEYRSHMDAARFLLRSRPIQRSRNDAFRRFIVEFFHFHDTSNVMTSLDRRPDSMSDVLRMPDFVPQPHSGALLGIFDVLFVYISKISELRDQVRERMNLGFRPAVDYQTLSEAVAIDSAIRGWEPTQSSDNPSWIGAQLYRQCTWVYLYRTIRPSKPHEKIDQVVNDGLELLRQIPKDAGLQSVLLMPLFLLGCAAFRKEQRPDIQAGFDEVQAYSNLGNIKPAREIVEKVWTLMDAGDEASWDWEKIIQDMGYDFLIT